jgi:hypothetical protein
MMRLVVDQSWGGSGLDCIAMTVEYEIIDVFEITGRGAVVLLSEATDRNVGKPHQVEVVTLAGNVVKAQAEKEYLLLRTTPTSIEKECFLLRGMRKNEIPASSRLRFLD